MDLNKVYFWTDTILDWNYLLAQDKYKEIIVNSWRTLVSRKKLIIYAFVIMPNHLHLLWELLAMNGKEMPHVSFNKFTSHQFLEDLRFNDPIKLEKFVDKRTNRSHRFWQRDPLAVLMDYSEKAYQKLDYIHMNPLQEHWQLAEFPEDYYWSSAKFYETGIDDFGFLTNLNGRLE